VPHMIALALLGAGVYAGYRWLKRTREIEAQMRRTEVELRRKATERIEKDMGTLEYDLVSGVYKPIRRLWP